MSASDSPQTASAFTNDALGNDDATALADAPFFTGVPTFIKDNMNVAGAPVIALPMSLTPDKLPVSMQLMGRHGDERFLPSE